MRRGVAAAKDAEVGRAELGGSFESAMVARIALRSSLRLTGLARQRAIPSSRQRSKWESPAEVSKINLQSANRWSPRIADASEKPSIWGMRTSSKTSE